VTFTFVFSALCARKSHYQYANLHTTEPANVVGWLAERGFALDGECACVVDEKEAVAAARRAGVWAPAAAAQLNRLLMECAARVGQCDLSVATPTQLRLRDDDLAAFADGDGAGGARDRSTCQAAFRLRFAFLRRFNALAAKVLHLVDMRQASSKTTVAGLISRARSFLFADVKQRL
jgi:hypothetical protein